MTKKNARAIALEVVVQVNEEGGYANLALDKALFACPDLDARDRGFITEIVYGSLKYRGRLDYILNQFSRTQIVKMDRWTRNILRISLYQMLFLDKVPVSAAVNEAVHLAKQYGHHGSDKFVNGVLRNIERKNEQIVYPNKGKQPVQYFAVWHSFPQWIIEKLMKQFGRKDTEAICAYFNEAAPLWIRTNTLKISRDQLQQRLAAEGIHSEVSQHTEEGLLITSGVQLHSLELFQQGYFIVQDESSMLVALAAQPERGQKVLDACSAPGGKTTHLAQLMKNSGEIYACDIHTHRLELVSENCRRLGIENVTICHQDGLTISQRWQEAFDIVLVDAPCTGLGVLGRRPDARWTKHASDIKNLSHIQEMMLEQASRTLRPGGTLVYSTCTITQEENQHIIDTFLEAHPDFYLDQNLPHCWKNIEKGQEGYVQFLPGLDGMDGFFIAKMKKSM